MDSRQPYRGNVIGGGLTGPVPSDLWLLLGLVLGTFALQFSASTAWLPAALRLTPAVWERGFLWQLVSYPFIGTGAPGFWFVLALLILFLFGRDVFYQLGRRRFWRLLLMVAATAAVVAVVLELGARAAGAAPRSFPLLQGQNMLLTVLVAAFATLNRQATILLFFVLPVQARWFLWLEVLFAFMGFLASGDLAGFVGICTAVGVTYGHLTSWRSLRGDGLLRRPWLHARHLWLRARLAWERRRRGLRVVRGEGDRRGNGPWVH